MTIVMKLGEKRPYDFPAPFEKDHEGRPPQNVFHVDAPQVVAANHDEEGHPEKGTITALALGRGSVFIEWQRAGGEFVSADSISFKVIDGEPYVLPKGVPIAKGQKKGRRRSGARTIG